jgi:ribose transport system substrate-binding protein
MRKLLYFILIGIVAVSMVVIAAAQTTAQVSDEVKELQEAVGYKWQPAELDKWNIDTLSYKKDPPYTIALSTNHMGVTWMDIYVAEMKEEIEMYGDDIAKFIHVDAGGDIPTQIANIEDLISRKVDAIIIDPASPTALVPVVEKAFDAGIVTIVNKSGIATTKYTAFQNNDEVQFGQSGAQWLVEELGGKGIVLSLRGIPGYGVEIERWSGGQSVFKKYPDIKVFAEYAYWSYDKAKEVSKALIAAHPEFDGIWSEGGQMSRAFVDALVEAGLNPADYPHASEDDNGYCKQVLKYGINSCATGKPVWLSRLAVRSALDALRGVYIEKYVMVPSPFYGPDEIAEIVNPEVSDLSWLTTTLSDEKINEMFK